MEIPPGATDHFTSSDSEAIAKEQMAKVQQTNAEELLERAVELLEKATPGKRTVNVTDQGGEHETYHILADGEEIFFIDGPRAREDVPLLKLLDPGLLLPILKPFASGVLFVLESEAVKDVIEPIMAEMVGLGSYEQKWVSHYGSGSDKDTVTHFMPGKTADSYLMHDVQPGDWQRILEYVLAKARKFAETENKRLLQEATQSAKTIEIIDRLIGAGEDIPY